MHKNFNMFLPNTDSNETHHWASLWFTKKKKPAVYLYPEPDKSYPLPISSGVISTSAYHIILCIVRGICLLNFSNTPFTNFHSPPSVPHTLLTSLTSKSMILNTLIIFGRNCKSFVFQVAVQKFKDQDL